VSESEIRFVGDLQRVERKPGDVFVLSVPFRPTVEQVGVLREQLRRGLGEDAKVIVLPEGLKLGVVGDDSAKIARDIRNAYEWRDADALNTALKRLEGER
jgi:hypothetical protein